MIAATLPDAAGYEEWRDVARRLLAFRVRPDEVAWRDPDLPELMSVSELPPAPANAAMTAPRAFVDVARKAALHNNRGRFALLYRVLWRPQEIRALMQDAADADVARLNALVKDVRRDEHKMHAFVRFKEVAGADGPRFVAWFEPQHHILRETADFFVRRFAGMRWSIITPEASAHWDGAALTFGPGGRREDVPAEDARDGDWRAYYEHMFNPARLNTEAMTRHMPKRYWRNLPEAESIAPLTRRAGARTSDMLRAAPSLPRKRAGAAHARIAPASLAAPLLEAAGQRAAPATMDDLRAALSACRACPLWRDATQAVPPEGPDQAPLMALVGEQPGDQEDIAGRPFVGPAGQVLDRALAAAGVPREALYVTNAVKHFKHELRGKRRLHKRPERSEVETCRWWLAGELRLTRPALVLALGATALSSLSHHRGALSAVRGQDMTTREGAPLRATIHPSFLLRLPPEADHDAEFARFVADLKDAFAHAQSLREASATL